MILSLVLSAEDLTKDFIYKLKRTLENNFIKYKLKLFISFFKI